MINQFSDIVTEYCKHHKNLKDYTLARKIYEENKDKFKSVEQVRNMVRYRRGHSGEQNRERLTIKGFETPKTYDTRNSPKFEVIETGAKILIIDIETAPIRGWVWGIWNQNVSIDQIQSDWFVLTWAAKWLFEDKVYSGCLTPKEAVEQDDKRIMEGI